MKYKIKTNGIIIGSALSLALVSSLFANDNEPIVVTQKVNLGKPLPSSESELLENLLPTQGQTTNNTIPVENNKDDLGFKNSLIFKVDEKMNKLTELVEENARLQEVNRMNSQNQTQSKFSNSGSELSLPVVVGTTTISKKIPSSNKVDILSSEAMVIDASGNRFLLNKTNNSIIKNVHSDYIDFVDSDKKIPILIANEDSSESKKLPEIKSTMGITGIDERLKTEKNNVAVPSLKEGIIKELVNK